MCALTPEDRQSILNQVYIHFIVNRQPAGRVIDAKCAYHAVDEQRRQVSCAIGIFDTGERLACHPLNGMCVINLEAHSPDVLADIFDRHELGEDDVRFLYAVQREHDRAVAHAATLEDFDRCFTEELDLRLARLALEWQLDRPMDSAGQ